MIDLASKILREWDMRSTIFTSGFASSFASSVMSGLTIALTLGTPIALPVMAESIPRTIPRTMPSQSICHPQGHFEQVRAIVFSLDGQKVITASADWSLRVWDRKTQTEERVLVGHRGAIDHLQLSPDGTRVISGGRDGTIRVWDWRTGREIHVLQYPSNHRGIFLTLNPRINTLTKNDPYRLLNQDELEQNLVTYEPARFEAIAVNPKGDRLVGSDGFGNLKVWDLGTGKELEKLENFDPKQFKRQLFIGLTFSADGRSLLMANAAYEKFTVSRWDLKTGTEQQRFSEVSIQKFSGHITWAMPYPNTLREQHLITGLVQFSPDGNYLAIVSDRGLVVQNLQTGAIIGPKSHSEFNLTTLDQQTVLAIEDRGTLQIWDLQQDKLIKTAKLTDRPFEYQFGNWFQIHQSFKLAPDGQTVLDGESYDRLISWDVSNGKATIFNRFARPIQAMKVSANGQTIAGWVEGRIQIAQVANPSSTLRRLPRALPTESESPLIHIRNDAFLLTPDGRTLITNHEDGVIRLWNVATGKQTGTLGESTMPGSMMVLTPDGKTLIRDRVAHSSETSRNSKSGLEWWNLETGQLIHSQPWERNGFDNRIVMSEDGHSLLTYHRYSDRVTLWNAKTSEPIRSFNLKTSAEALALSPDGRWILAADFSSQITRWNTLTGEKMQSFMIPPQVAPPHSDRRVQSLKLLADQRTIMIEYNDRWIEFWDLILGKPKRSLDTQGNAGPFITGVSPQFRSPQWQSITDLHATNNGKTLYTSSRDGTLKQWNLQTGQLQRTWCPQISS
jgi:WD40 repeat protein